MSILNREYKDFSLKIHEKTGRSPLVGQVELTYHCNLRCRYCYVGKAPKKKELDYKKFCRIFDKIHEAGCLWLVLTGGEPLLRSDFLDIYAYLYKKGFIITIFTNATLFTKEIARYLRKFTPFAIEVTLNSVTKKRYEVINQVPGSFEKAMAGIELIRRYNLPMRFKCQVMTLNIEEVSSIEKFYKNSGAEYGFTVEIGARLDGSTEPCIFRLSPKKALEFTRREEIIEAKGLCEDDFFKEKNDELFRCPGGKQAFYINPFGELFFCNGIRKPSWDLKKYSFKKCFYDFFPKILSQKFKTNSKCRFCSLRGICLSCPGKAWLEYGDLETPVSYYCEMAKLRHNDTMMRKK